MNSNMLEAHVYLEDITMLRNILVEKILCERYQNKTDKNCGCKELIEDNVPTTETTTSDITSKILSMLSQGLIGVQAATQLLSDANKLLKPYNPPETQDKYSPSDTPNVRLIQPEPGLKTPRKTKIKEFGQASGQVISPS
jgi:hypothetical protein